MGASKARSKVALSLPGTSSAMDEFVWLHKLHPGYEGTTFCGTDREWEEFTRLRDVDTVRYEAFKKDRRRKRQDSIRDLMSFYRRFFVETVLKEQRGSCFWCGTILNHLGDCEVDHILPVSRGGSHARENLCVACVPCNQTKADRDPEEFVREAIADLL